MFHWSLARWVAWQQCALQWEIWVRYIPRQKFGDRHKTNYRYIVNIVNEYLWINRSFFNLKHEKDLIINLLLNENVHKYSWNYSITLHFTSPCSNLMFTDKGKLTADTLEYKATRWTIVTKELAHRVNALMMNTFLFVLLSGISFI